MDPRWRFSSSRLRDAYVALQTWKQEAIFFDPKNLTADWVGPEVCNYTGVFCAPLPWDRTSRRSLAYSPIARCTTSTPIVYAVCS
ncbi:hypothetical protein E2562_005895 [Oryza meyeriana var. granulata]|uniref:Leucine-rich repeat-containing N-terminal plant-type domain-containing protein n=1 Tax=Oryza meyeriana var. granulata TaxID=110450 RepID=A0A6G1DVQ6_9ORYZ|nr:hypothetical protein E2562_005895 [Oryza meyeriana var. granulata]